MKPSLDLAGVKNHRWWEHPLRFFFGGAVAVGTGLIARRFGPIIGGLFLGFPAIIPATLTLVKAHEGRRQAIAETVGARFGAVGLVGFAATVWQLAAWAAPAIALALPLIVWLLVSILGWACGSAHRNED